MKKKFVVVVLFTSLVILVVTALFFTQKSFSRAIKVAVQYPKTVLTADYDHYLPCDKLPSVAQVKKVFIARRLELLQLVSRGTNKVNNIDMKEYNNNQNDPYALVGGYLVVRVSEYTKEN